jgi:hypothetical protein
MARLSRHPDILVAQNHPHELKLVSYYTAVLRTLVTESDRQRSTNPDGMHAVPNRFFVGFNPYHTDSEKGDPALAAFWNELAPRALRKTLTELIDTYYQKIADATSKPSATLFAEKIGTVGQVLDAASFMFGHVREILLVRDPRDIICSSKSFWNREFMESVKSLKGQFIGMARPRDARSVHQHVVRYEDLLLRPQQTMGDLFSALGLRPVETNPNVLAEADVFARHATSTSPAETISRWQRDLTAEQAEIATAELNSVLLRYGYSTT